MTPQEKRRFKRHRKQRLWNIVHTVILFCLTVTMILVLGNLYTLTVMQTDTLNQIVDLRQEIDEVGESIETGRENPPPIDYTTSGTTYSVTLTDTERDILCSVVAAEARGEDLIGQEAVAQVIRDRSVAWGMSITEVVTAPSQFAKPYSGEISDSVKLAVANVFDGNISVLEVPTTHFHAEYVEPYWIDGKANRGSIGCHTFYY